MGRLANRRLARLLEADGARRRVDILENKTEAVSTADKLKAAGLSWVFVIYYCERIASSLRRVKSYDDH
jgi:hypothetical protein